MKRLLFIVLTGCNLLAGAQPLKQLTLATAWELAQKNYPAVKQKDLVRKTASISLENLQKGFLPQFTISGQATYQSDVTSISVSKLRIRTSTNCWLM